LTFPLLIQAIPTATRKDIVTETYLATINLGQHEHDLLAL